MDNLYEKILDKITNEKINISEITSNIKKSLQKYIKDGKFNDIDDLLFIFDNIKKKSEIDISKLNLVIDKALKNRNSRHREKKLLNLLIYLNKYVTNNIEDINNKILKDPMVHMFIILINRQKRNYISENKIYFKIQKFYNNLKDKELYSFLDTIYEIDNSIYSNMIEFASSYIEDKILIKYLAYNTMQDRKKLYDIIKYFEENYSTLNNILNDIDNIKDKDYAKIINIYYNLSKDLSFENKFNITVKNNILNNINYNYFFYTIFKNYPEIYKDLYINIDSIANDSYGYISSIKKIVKEVDLFEKPENFIRDIILINRSKIEVDNSKMINMYKHYKKNIDNILKNNLESFDNISEKKIFDILKKYKKNRSLYLYTSEENIVLYHKIIVDNMVYEILTRSREQNIDLNI